MHRDENTAVFEELCLQAVQLVKANPRDHQLMNDAGMIAFLAKMHAKGIAVDVDEVRRCLARMRVGVESGVYPEELAESASRGAVRCGGIRRLHGGAMALVLDGLPERGQFQFVPLSDSFELLYLATSGPKLKPPILITDAMVGTAEIRGGVLYLRTAE